MAVTKVFILALARNSIGRKVVRRQELNFDLRSSDQIMSIFIDCARISIFNLVWISHFADIVTSKCIAFKSSTWRQDGKHLIVGFCLLLLKRNQHFTLWSCYWNSAVSKWTIYLLHNGVLVIPHFLIYTAWAVTSYIYFLFSSIFHIELQFNQLIY